MKIILLLLPLLGDGISTTTAAEPETPNAVCKKNITASQADVISMQMLHMIDEDISEERQDELNTCPRRCFVRTLIGMMRMVAAMLDCQYQDIVKTAVGCLDASDEEEKTLNKALLEGDVQKTVSVWVSQEDLYNATCCTMGKLFKIKGQKPEEVMDRTLMNPSNRFRNAARLVMLLLKFAPIKCRTKEKDGVTEICLNGVCKPTTNITHDPDDNQSQSPGDDPIYIPPGNDQSQSTSDDQSQSPSDDLSQNPSHDQSQNPHNNPIYIPPRVDQRPRPANHQNPHHANYQNHNQGSNQNPRPGADQKPYPTNEQSANNHGDDGTDQSANNHISQTNE